MNSYELGKGFAPTILCDVGIDERRKKWICMVSIGEEYYESDPCKYKKNALSEMLGYLEGIEINLKKKLKQSKKNWRKANDNQMLQQSVLAR